MALVRATAQAARQMDALAAAIGRVTTAVSASSAATPAAPSADRALADLFKRGLAPEAVAALRKSLGIR